VSGNGWYWRDMPERAPVVVAGLGIVFLALADPYSIPAGLLMLILGIFVGATMPWPEVPVLGPVAALRQRQPWTEPGFHR
jgi:hypothetical protein